MAQIALGDWRQCGLNPQPKTDKLYADGFVHSKQHSDLTAWERLIKYREQETGGGGEVKDTEEEGVRRWWNEWWRSQNAVGNASALPLKWRASSAEHLASKQLCPFNERTDTHASTHKHTHTTYWHSFIKCLPEIVWNTKQNAYRFMSGLVFGDIKYYMEVKHRQPRLTAGASRLIAPLQVHAAVTLLIFGSVWRVQRLTTVSHCQHDSKVYAAVVLMYWMCVCVSCLLTKSHQSAD